MALRSTVSFSKGDLQWRLGYRRLWFRGTDEISENRDNLFMDLRYRSFGNFLIEGTGFYTRGRHLHLNSRPKEWGTGLKLIQYHPRLGISETLLVQYENGTYPPSEAKTDRLVTIFQLTKKVGPRLFITPEIKYVNFKNQEQKRPLETISARTFDFASFLEYRFSALSLLAKAIYATGRDRRDFDSYIIEGGFVYALNLRLPSRIGKNTYHLGNRVTIQPGYRYARYFHLGEKLSAVYLQFNLFM
ncbi:MAG: hypothetical protein ONB05_06755 [candidate division KSB1 bacterium]|nr:hypothetical protein [candidate division KSB1 bacterium]